VKINSTVAGSIILASLNLLLGIVALLLFVTRSAWGLVLCWIFIPLLLVIQLFFLGRDLFKPIMRKQAVSAGVLSLPALALEIWFFAHLNL
jgi:hypothetical protein